MASKIQQVGQRWPTKWTKACDASLLAALVRQLKLWSMAPRWASLWLHTSRQKISKSPKVSHLRRWRRCPKIRPDTSLIQSHHWSAKRACKEKSDRAHGSMSAWYCIACRCIICCTLLHCIIVMNKNECLPLWNTYTKLNAYWIPKAHPETPWNSDTFAKNLPRCALSTRKFCWLCELPPKLFHGEVGCGLGMFALCWGPLATLGHAFTVVAWEVHQNVCRCVQCCRMLWKREANEVMRFSDIWMLTILGSLGLWQGPFVTDFLLI